jgi:hypothetical protein
MGKENGNIPGASGKSSLIMWLKISWKLSSGFFNGKGSISVREKVSGLR